MSHFVPFSLSPPQHGTQWCTLILLLMLALTANVGKVLAMCPCCFNFKKGPGLPLELSGISLIFIVTLAGLISPKPWYDLSRGSLFVVSAGRRLPQEPGPSHPQGNSQHEADGLLSQREFSCIWLERKTHCLPVNSPCPGSAATAACAACPMEGTATAVTKVIPTCLHQTMTSVTHVSCISYISCIGYKIQEGNARLPSGLQSRSVCV